MLRKISFFAVAVCLGVLMCTTALADQLGTGLVASMTPTCSVPYSNGGSSVVNWDVQRGGTYTIRVAGITSTPYQQGKKTYTPNCSNPTFTVRNSGSSNMLGTNVSCTTDSTTHVTTCTFDVTINPGACLTMPIVYSCPTTISDPAPGGGPLGTNLTTYFAQGSLDVGLTGTGGEAHLVATTDCALHNIVTCGGCTGDCCNGDCGQNVKLTVCKWYDSNTNGYIGSGSPGGTSITSADSIEPAMSGWKFSVDGVPGFTTDASGCLTQTYSSPGLHTVTETLSAPWVQTGLIVDGTPQTIAVSTQVNVTGNDEVDFGNVCLGTGGALTLGFWANSNGQKVLCGGKQGSTNITACSGWQDALNALNLKNAQGIDFTIDTTKSCSQQAAALSSYLLSANATNMAYMLSAQLAAMQLNITCPSIYSTGGPTLPSMYVQSGQPPVECPAINYVTPAGFVNLGTLMADANAELATYTFTTSKYPTDRNCQEFKKTTLDSANNNIGFVQAPSACAPPQ